MHHHVVLMEEYLKNRQYAELEEYLSGYRRLLPDDTRISFCENTAVNAVVLYFAEQAKDGDIDFDARLSVPETVSVPAVELSVLFGNLLENAVDACNVETCDDKRILLRATADSASLCVTVDNTFTGNIKRSADGAVLSTKHSGEGLGLASVGVIAERYGGVFKTEQREGMFCASVLLNLSAKN